MNFLQFDFEPRNKEEAEQLIALLAEQDFEGFIEEGSLLIAFIPETLFNQTDFETILEKFAILAYTKSSIENINWNQKWEQEFEPVQVDNFAGIRAHFHAPLQDVRYEIIITPKMSFGTGHHATTFMMIQLMEGIEFSNKKVLDFGTGTGVLAILAEKMGASNLLAIDYDEWSITNAVENCEQNHCTRILLEQADECPDGGNYDVILANINLNVILANMNALASACKLGGKILFSGILDIDEQTITKAAESLKLNKKQRLMKKDWIALVFEK